MTRGAVVLRAGTQIRAIEIGVLAEVGRTRVNLGRVDEALRARPTGLSLIALLEALGGPLENRRERRADTRTALANVWMSVRGHPAFMKHP